MSTETTDPAAEAFEAGVHAGWDAANYAQAYGGDPRPSQDAVPGWVEHAPDGQRAALLREWEVGTAAGRVLFDRGQHPDGAPVG